ncbi:MAG: TonB-dependent receptor [Pseudomonadota bacterium]
MHTSSPLLATALIALAGAPAAVAQQRPNDRLDEIIVEATRLAQTTAEIGSSISIIDRERLDELAFPYALDALAHAPGVTINQNGAFGGQASVRIRGAASEQTLVLINGVPVNDTSTPGGGFNFARLDTENIERIEVLKGPQSTLWGTDAIGGVVSITTRRPEEGLGGSVFLEGGSFDTFRGGAAVGGAGDTGEFRIAATRTETDGISKADEDNGNREEDGFEADTVTLRGALNLPREARLSADLLWTDAESDFDSFVFGAQGNVSDGDETSFTEELSGNLSLSLPILDGRLTNLFLVGYSEIDRRNVSNGAESFAAEGERTLLRYQGTAFLGEQHTLAFGLEREETETTSDDTTIDGAFLLYEYQPIDPLTLTAGLRRDDHDEFGAETTARLAAAYAINEAITVRASWGEGFKAPTLFQTTFFCCGAVAANADLVPETSEAFDIGIDWRNERTTIGASLFRQDTEELITFSFAVGGYENIAEVESQGVELTIEHALSDAFSAALNYTYLDTETGTGDSLFRLPEHAADLTLNYRPNERWRGTLLVRHNGDEENTNGTTLDSWTRVDLSGSVILGERAEVFGRIENLLDEDYQQILGYGTPGRSATVGVRYRF